MTLKVEVNEKTFFKWRYTPWDRVVLSKNTAEILEVNYDSEKSLKELFFKVEEWIKESNIEVLFFRHDSKDQLVKKYAFENQFLIFEHTYDLEINRKNKLSPKRRFIVEKTKSEELEEIFNIAKEDFEFGRFQENPYIDVSHMQERYMNWMSQLFQENNLYTVKTEKHLVGFFAYRFLSDDTVDACISGIAKDFKGMGRFVWNDMYQYIFLEERVKKILAGISSSNIPVLNVNLSIGFKITHSNFGYYKEIITQKI